VAPALLGFGLLAGLWLDDAQRTPLSFDRLAVRLTRYLVTLFAWVLAAALAVFAAARAGPPFACLAAALAVLVIVHVAMALAARSQYAGDLQQCLGWTYGGYAAGVCLAALAALPIIDRWQDLPALARRIHADTVHDSLALLDPDETTIAMLDRGFATPFVILTDGSAAPHARVRDWLAAQGPAGRVLVLLPGHADGPLTRWLGRFEPRAAPGDGVAGRLIASGEAALIERYELPQGRRYALLGAPAP